MTTFTAKIATPEGTPGVIISSRVKFQTKPDYIPSMSDNSYETVNNQVKYEDTLHSDAHMFLCQELIEEVTDAAAVIVMQLSLKTGMKHWKGKG